MKHQFIRFFLLFVSAISLHGASAAPLESMLDQKISIISLASLEKSIVTLVNNAKSLLASQKTASAQKLVVQQGLEYYSSRILFLQSMVIEHCVALVIVDIETNITWSQQSLIYVQSPPFQVVKLTFLYSDLKSTHPFAVS